MRLASRLEKLERDDLVTFINACNACTRQAEFYSDDKGQGVSIEFLHEYILGNYRRLYARTLVAGINQFNKGLIIETSGAEDHVVKFLCPLVISDDNLKKGIDIVEQAIRETCAGEDSIPEEFDYFETPRLAS